MNTTSEQDSELSDERLRYIADNRVAGSEAAHWESVAMAAELLRLRRIIRKLRKSIG